MTLEELKVVIDAQTKPFRDELAKMQSQVQKSTETVTKHVSKIKSAMSGLTKFLAGLAIGRTLISMGKSAITFASDIEEVQNVVDTAFGNMSWKAEQFAKTAITQFGMSELSAKRTASTYMAMASGMGLGADKASDMAITLAGLTGDVASFYNISQELADTKLKSVFTGETETLKDLGIVMTQTNLQAYALSQGISKNVSDMSQAELTTLRYNYVLSKLSMAQGDFAKTSGSWANQLRILQEQWSQLLGIIGNGLISILTPVIRVINTIISKLITLANIIATVFGKLFGKKTSSQNAFSDVSDAVENSSDAIGGYSDAMDGVGSQAKKTAKEMEGALAGFDELNIIKTNSDSGSNGSGAGTKGIGGGGYDIDPIDWDSMFQEPDTSGIDAAVDKVIKKLNSFKDFFTEHKAVILAVIAGIIAAFGTLKGITAFSFLSRKITSLMGLINSWKLGIWQTIQVLTGLSGPILLIVTAIGLITGALVYLYQTSESFRNLVNEAINNIFSILSSLWTTVLQPLFSLLSDMFFTIIVPLAEFLATILVQNVETVFNVLLSLWNEVLAPIAQFLVDILAIALQGVIDVWESWKPLIDGLFEKLNWIWNEIFVPIADYISGVFTHTFEEWGKVIETLIPSIEIIFQGLIDFFSGVFSGDISKIWEGITEIFQGFDDFLTGVFEIDWTNSFGNFGKVLNYFFETIDTIWTGIKDIFEGVITFITGVFSGDWEAAWQGVQDIFSGIFDMLSGLIKQPINAVIDIVNGAIDRINGIGFDVPDWVPFIGGESFRIDVPRIPQLAEGGIANKATLSILGEAGTEAVIPLKRNTQGIEMIANKLLENMPVNSGGGTYLIQLVLEDGTILAKKIIKNIKDYEIVTGKPAF